MKRENEYIFKDTLEPKNLWQKIKFFLGTYKKVEEYQRVICRPTFEQLAIPTNEEIKLIINGLSIEEKVFLKLLYLANNVKSMCGLSSYEARLMSLKLVFFDGVYFSLSPVGHKIAKIVSIEGKI